MHVPSLSKTITVRNKRASDSEDYIQSFGVHIDYTVQEIAHSLHTINENRGENHSPFGVFHKNNSCRSKYDLPFQD